MNENNNPRKRPELGILGFALAFTALFIIAYFLEDGLGVPYHFLLSFIWAGVMSITFLFGLIYLAPYITPLPGNDGWWEGLRLILRGYLQTAVLFFNKDRSKASKQTRRRKATAKLAPRSLDILHAGYMRSYEVLAITKGNSYARAAGPGFIILYKKEAYNKIVIDLRTQFRKQPIHFITRDGIHLKSNVNVVFQVRQKKSAYPDDMLYPYDKDAIFHINYANTIDQDGNLMPWTEQIFPRAALLVSQALSRYDLNTLLNPGALSPIEQVKKEVKEQLAQTLHEEGITLYTVGIGPLQLPPEVQKQHIDSWKANWERQIKIEEAGRQAEALRLIKQARARAQIQIIENIIQNLEAMRQGGSGESDLYQIIILRMIEALEEAVSDGSVQALIPQQIMANLVNATSTQMQKSLARSLSASDPDPSAQEAAKEKDDPTTEEEERPL